MSLDESAIAALRTTVAGEVLAPPDAGFAQARADLVEARDLLEARSEKLADLKAERAMGWQA